MKGLANDRASRNKSPSPALLSQGIPSVVRFLFLVFSERRWWIPESWPRSYRDGGKCFARTVRQRNQTKATSVRSVYRGFPRQCCDACQDREFRTGRPTLRGRVGGKRKQVVALSSFGVQEPAKNMRWSNPENRSRRSRVAGSKRQEEGHTASRALGWAF